MCRICADLASIATETVYTLNVAMVRHHYERAFEAYLRARRIPYVGVNEARKSLLPKAGHLRLAQIEADGATPDALKSFDFIIYGKHRNLLIDVKGRRLGGRRSQSVQDTLTDIQLERHHRTPQLAVARLDSWVTEDDIKALTIWEGLFGKGFKAAFVFMYWCPEAPPDGMFHEIMEHDGKWYAMRGVLVEDYAACCKPRSAKWRTVDVPAAAFERISHPFAPAWAGVAEPTGSPAVSPTIALPGGSPHRQ